MNQNKDLEKKVDKRPKTPEKPAGYKLSDVETVSPEMAARRNRRIAVWIIAILAAIWLIAGANALVSWVTNNIDRTDSVSVSSENDGNINASGDEVDVSEAVKKVSPGVVSIVTKKGRGDNSSFWSSRQLEGAGTGMIISSSGYVLTNKHVVRDASSITIVSSEGEQFSNVKLVGSDPLNDVAFLKIDGESNLPVVEFGDSGTVRVGQRVIAIGNSLGQYQNTVTSGIISGKGRPVEAATDSAGANYESLTDLLQTDAAINPGNSGGPLVNTSGQVIGINTAIASDAQGMGFAIPINATKGLVRGVLDDGTIKKSYIGVRFTEITPEVRAEYKLKEKTGAYIGGGSSRRSSVVKDGPADKAGIKDGDIITKVGDKTVGEHGGLGSLVSEYLPGEKAEITIVRDGKEKKLSITFGSYNS